VTKRGRLTRDLAALVEERVAGCNLCSSHRSQVVIEDLCERLGFSLAECRRTARAFICSHCEAGPQLYETLAEWEPDEWADIRRRRRWERRYGHRLWSMVELLERTPSLGLLHPVGQELLAAVRRGRISTVTNNPWWRACCKGDATAPPAARFLPADPHAVSIPAQRFNHAGQAALYVSDCPDTASAEILVEEEGALWIAALRFKRALRLLDLRIRILGEGAGQALLLSGLNLSQPKAAGDKAPREYVLTRFIADLVRRRHSVDGVIYTSSRLAPFGTNLVVVRNVPVVVSVAPARYRWSWKMLGPPFGSIRSHMKAEPLS
jgi:RES domain-containing protein